MRKHTQRELAAELEDLRARLAEAEEGLRAIRNGDMDAVLVTGKHGEQVYTLSGADRIYRQLIETMSEGAVTLSANGVILYCNVRLAEMLGRPLDQVLGTALRNYLPPADQQALDAILAQVRTVPSRREINLKTSEGRLVPVYLSASRLQSEGTDMVFCLVLTDLTEQKSHEQIVAAERLARLILEQAAEAIVVCDEQGRVIRASQAAQRFCDGSPLLRPFAEVFPLRIDASDPFLLAPVLQGETLRNVDVALDRHGQKLDLILNAGPVLNDQQILGCVVTLTDITERKRAEAEHNKTLLWQQGINLVQQSLLAPAPLEDKLRNITDSIVRLFGADFCRIWLIRPGDLCERGCVHAGVNEGPHVCRYRDRCLHLLASSGRYTHIDGKTHRRVPFGAYKIGRVASSEDHKFLTNDAPNDPRVHNHEWARELGLVSFAGYQLRIPGGEALGVLGLFAKHPILPAEDALLDGLSSALAQVIQQAQAEEALRASEQRLRRAEEVAHLGNWAFFLAENRARTSEGARLVYGVGDKELTINEAQTITLPEYRAMMDAALIALIERGVPYNVEFKIHRPSDGKIIDVHAMAEYDPERKIVFGVVQDITERKQAEEESSRLQAQLIQSQKLEALGTLASGVAHEINNPIAGIMNYAQLIADTAAPESRAVEYAGEIVHETERVAIIVRNLLQFARQEKQAHSPARLADIVEQSLSLLRGVLRRDQIALTVDVPEDLPPVKCRSQQIQQVVMNLLTNARDALNAKYPGYHADKTIQVSARPFEQAGRPWLRLTVADQGTGIPPEIQARIFDPFFTTKPRDKGTGLGLSISHGIVQDHQGLLHFETEPGIGTQFHLDLPVDNGWTVEEE